MIDLLEILENEFKVLVEELDLHVFPIQACFVKDCYIYYCINFDLDYKSDFPDQNALSA